MNDSIRVMFVDVSGKGGITHYTVMLCKAVAETNIQVHLLTTRTCEMDLQKVRFKHEGRLFAHHSKKSDFAKGVIYILSLCIVFLRVLKSKPHIVHWQELKIYILEYSLIKWMKRKGIKTVCSVHDVVHLDRTKVTRHLKKLYLEFDALVAHTEDTKSLLMKRFGVPADRVRVIPIGVFSGVASDEALTKPEARRLLRIDSNGPVLLFFGYIRKYKGLDLLLEAMPEVLKKHPRTVLIIAGETKEDFRDYEQLMSDLHISHAIVRQIQYIPIEHIPRYFIASDAVMMPYRNIHQSGIVHLAFAFRRPVVATRVGGLPEVVREGKNGFLVPKNDVRALARTTNRALSNLPMLERMGEYAFRESKKSLSWIDIAEKAASLYHELHTEKHGS